MKIPKTEKIGGDIYKVKIIKKFRGKDKKIVADINYDTLVIRLAQYNIDNERISKTRMFENLIHETLHGVDHSYNAHALSEKTVYRLSEGIYQVIKDNFIGGEK